MGIDDRSERAFDMTQDTIILFTYEEVTDILARAWLGLVAAQPSTVPGSASGSC